VSRTEKERKFNIAKKSFKKALSKEREDHWGECVWCEEGAAEGKNFRLRRFRKQKTTATMADKESRRRENGQGKTDPVGARAKTTEKRNRKSGSGGKRRKKGGKGKRNVASDKPRVEVNKRTTWKEKAACIGDYLHQKNKVPTGNLVQINYLNQQTQRGKRRSQGGRHWGRI